MRIYKPTETHLVLHPPRDIRVCATPGCGVRFASRPTVENNEDEDPAKCLSCNRAQWSRLWSGNKPTKTVVTIQECAIEFDLTADPALVSDTDVGEVISIRRSRR